MPPTSIAFAPSDPVEVVSVAERERAGLAHWVDGTMGFHRVGDRTFAIAPNGPVLARHDVAAGLVGGLVGAEQRIQGLPQDVRHASGGPVHRDERTGLLLLVYHGETFRDGDHRDFWSFLGLAVSDDDGASFHDLGRIVTSDLEEGDPERPRPVELGSGAFVVRDGWMRVYVQDRSSSGIRLNLGVARARLDEVLHCAQEGTTPVFHKFHRGAFTEPGLGGRCSELLAGVPRSVCWFDVTHLEAAGLDLLVYSTPVWRRDGVWWWNHATAVSPDGLGWSMPRLLHPREVPGETLYVTIDPGPAGGRTVPGDRFGLYRVRSTAPYRWDDACLEHVTVTWRPGSGVRGRTGTLRPMTGSRG